MYTTREEAQQKLKDSVVLFDNKASLVIDAENKNGSLKLFHYLLRDKGKLLNNPIGEFDLKTIGTRLGYMNYSDEHGYNSAVYVTRSPVRRAHSTQGLCASNIIIPSVRRRDGRQKDLDLQFIYTSGYFADMVESKYPSLVEVKREMEKDSDVVSKAFSRIFSVTNPKVGPFFLNYKNKKIAYSDDMFRWKLGKDFSYLEEELDYNNIRVA